MNGPERNLARMSHEHAAGFVKHPGFEEMTNTQAPMTKGV